MDKQLLPRLIAVVTLITVVKLANANTCYTCMDEPDGYLPYDPDCGMSDYQGIVTNGSNYHNCVTRVYAEGHGGVARYGVVLHFGECGYEPGYFTEFYCTGEN
ncbi:unnamed protein product, partial [Meganyctiphanes norvegica]